MMRTATAALAIAAALICAAGLAHAQTDTITVTVSLAEVVSVSVSPGAWDLGAVSLSDVSAPESFTATNDGNVTEDLTITGANAANGWNIASGQGADEFMVALDGSTALSTTPIALTSSLASGGNHEFTLTYYAPSSDTQGGGVSHGFTVTVTAAKTP